MVDKLVVRSLDAATTASNHALGTPNQQIIILAESLCLLYFQVSRGADRRRPSLCAGGNTYRMHSSTRIRRGRICSSDKYRLPGTQRQPVIAQIHFASAGADSSKCYRDPRLT